MKNMKKLPMLLLAIMAPTALEAGKRVRAPETKVDVGTQIGTALGKAVAELATELAKTGATLGMNLASTAAQSAINNNENISAGTKEQLKSLVDQTNGHVLETFSTVANHANNLAQLGLDHVAGNLSAEDFEAEQAAAAAELAKYASSKAGAIAQLALTTGGNIASHEAGLAAEKTDNTYLKQLATAGGDAASKFANTAGSMSNSLLTITGDAEYNKKMDEADALFDKAEELYGPEVGNEIANIEEVKAAMTAAMQGQEDELIAQLGA